MIKKYNVEDPLFRFFKTRFGVMFSSEELDEIIKELNINEKEFVRKLNYKLNLFRLINILMALVFVLIANLTNLGMTGVSFCAVGYLLINLIIMLSNIYNSTHNDNDLE